MAFLDDLEGGFTRRANRVNPDASIFTAPSDNRQDWLRQSIKKLAETGYQRVQDATERGRRQRFIDDAEGQNFGTKPSSNAARGRAFSAGVALDEARTQKRGIVGAFQLPGQILRSQQGDNSRFEQAGANFTDFVRNKANADYDRQAIARQYIKDSTSRSRFDIFDDFKQEFEMNKGRGAKWEEWKSMSDRDPVGFLAASTNPRGAKLPPEVQALVDERRARDPGIQGFYLRNTTTPIAGAIRQFADSDQNVFNRGKTKLANQFVGGLASGMVESGFERPAAAADYLAAKTVGQEDFGHRVSRNTGTNFQDNTFRQNLGLGIDSASTLASMALPGAFSGKLLKGVLEKAGVKVASSLGIKGLAFAEGFGANAAVDLPSTYASMKLQGYDNHDIVRTLLPTLAGDAFAAGGVGLAKEANSKAFKAAFGNTLVGSSLSAGVAAYAGARATGMDNEQALKVAGTAAAATLLYSAARLAPKGDHAAVTAGDVPPVAFHPVADPKVFEDAKSQSTRAWNLSAHTPEEFAASKAFMTEDGKAGYMLSPEGDIQNVFNNGGPKGAGQAALLHAIENGGKMLDAYAGNDPFLPRLYAQFGFKPTEAMKFVDEYAPAGWDYAKDGRPDIIFMRYEGGDPATLRERIGTFPDYEHPGKYTTDWDAAKQLTAKGPLDAADSGGTRAGLGQPEPGLLGREVGAPRGAGLDPNGRAVAQESPGGHGWDVSPEDLAFGREDAGPSAGRADAAARRQVAGDESYPLGPPQKLDNYSLLSHIKEKAQEADFARRDAAATLKALEGYPAATQAELGPRFQAQVDSFTKKADAAESEANWFRAEADRRGLYGNPPAAGITEGTATQMSDPMTQAALRAGGSAAYGYLSGDGDTNDRLARAAEFGLAGGLGSVTGHAAMEKIAKKVASTGKFIVDPAEAGPGARDNAAIEMAMLKSKEQAEKLKEPVKPGAPSAEGAARLKKSEDAKTAAVNQRKLEAAAPPEQVKAFETKNDDYMVHAESMVEDPHYMNRILAKVPGGETLMHAINSVADPAANKTSFLSKKVLAATVASVDYLRTTAGTQSNRAHELINNLEPLVGRENHLGNAARQGAALATPLAAGYVAGEVTGDDRLKELGILAGAGAMGFTSGHQAVNKFSGRPWEAVKYRGLPGKLGKDGKPVVADALPAKLRSGPGKLYDILQNPERYDLNEAQLKGVQAYNKAHDEMTRETNAALQASGSEVIPFREGHGILQFFTEDSVKRIFGEDGAKAFRMETPGFDRLRSPQMMRDLGPTYESALRDHPGLELIKDPLQLLKLEVKRHDQIRANAMLVRNLKDSGGAWAIPPEVDIAKMDTQARLDMTTHKANLERDGWRRLPGIDDHLFAPEIVKTVDELLLPKRGHETDLLSVADGLTNVLRQAMFTGDLSAWTMQGAMAAINDPLGTIANAPHLIGASVFGKRYFDYWVKRHADIWEAYTKSGGVGGLEHEGLEKQGKLSLSHVPGIKQIEERGFEAFLPIHRASMFDLQRQQENFIKNLGPSKLGKVPLGRRLASEFLKNGPLALGVGAAATGVDIPGIDDQYEAAFALALGLASNVGTRAALNAEARYAGETLPKASLVKSNVQAAKQVNRTSGALNRQSLGITANQAQWERTLGARSPALFRNTFILAKKASTDFGPEGAMARFYLVKTAALMGAGMAGIQYLATGEMPSLNPMDEDSIFNPKSANFLKAQGDAAGAVTASNPIVSLVKAFMRTDSPDGVRKWRMEDWVPMVGLTDWYTARTPDVAGAFIRPVAQPIGDAAQSSLHDAGIGAEGNAPDFPRPLWQPPVPLTAKAAFTTGVVQNHSSLGKTASPFTDKIGLKADPAYNNGRERAAALLSTFTGLNHRPESLGREMTRIKTDEVNKQFPGLQDRPNASGVKDGVVDYNDLNQDQQGGVRSALEKDKRYTDLKGKVEDKSKQEDSPVQSYFNRLNDINANYEGKMQDLDSRYKSRETSPFDAKKEYQFLAETRRKEISDAQTDLGKLAAQRKGTDEDVLGYLGRYMKPEDMVVNDWYKLFDEATGKDGKLDFNKLDKLQAAFKTKTPPEYRDYLEKRLASFDKPQTTQFGRDYDAAKAQTKSFYDVQDSIFNQVKASGEEGMFSGFNSFADFETAVNEEAARRGMQPKDLMYALGRGDRNMRRFNALVDREQLNMRRSNPTLDAALVDFYGKTPAKGTEAYRKFKLQRRDMMRAGREGDLFSTSQ